MNIKREIVRLDKKLVKLIKLIGELADKESLRACLVGGFVRDVFLKIRNFDIDVIVEKDGIRFAGLISKILKGRLLGHSRFKTAVVSFGNFKIDVATFRKEEYPYPGSLPVVSSGSLSDDLARRDFSINAMAVSINKNDFGFVFDYFLGLNDLKRKQLRVLHDKSFIDDPLRILRLARFKTRFGFSVEPVTLSLIKQAKKQKSLENMQKHRIRDELILIFKEARPEKPLKYLDNIYGWQFISPNLYLSRDLENKFRLVRKTCIWFENNFLRRRKLDIWIMYLILFLSKLRITELRKIARQLALKRGEALRLLSFNSNYIKVIRKLENTRLKPSFIYNILNPLSYEVILDCYVLANHTVRKNIKDYLLRYNLMRIKLSGEDLKKIGISPGPNFKRLFAKVKEEKLNVNLRTKEQELLFVKKLLKK
ncbi:MAG: hypothetical protein AB1629_06345 [Candidatus Omnitrophota bacterium]